MLAIEAQRYAQRTQYNAGSAINARRNISSGPVLSTPVPVNTYYPSNPIVKTGDTPNACTAGKATVVAVDYNQFGDRSNTSKRLKIVKQYKIDSDKELSTFIGVSALGIITSIGVSAMALYGTVSTGGIAAVFAIAALVELFSGGVAITVNANSLITGIAKYRKVGSFYFNVLGLSNNMPSKDRLIGTAELLLNGFTEVS